LVGVELLDSGGTCVSCLSADHTNYPNYPNYPNYSDNSNYSDYSDNPNYSDNSIWARDGNRCAGQDDGEAAVRRNASHGQI
jgi:hypothetical protein